MRFHFSSLPNMRRATSPSIACSLRQDFFTAVPVDNLLDNFDPKTRSCWRIHPAVDMAEGLSHEVVLHGISQRLELEQLAGRRIEGDREARRRSEERRV